MFINIEIFEMIILTEQISCFFRGYIVSNPFIFFSQAFTSLLLFQPFVFYNSPVSETQRYPRVRAGNIMFSCLASFIMPNTINEHRQKDEEVFLC